MKKFLPIFAIFAFVLNSCSQYQFGAPLNQNTEEQLSANWLPPEPCDSQTSSVLHSYISVQQSPTSRTLAWRMYILAPYQAMYNNYVVKVEVNDQQEDVKDQAYEPHGSISPTRLKVGDIVQIRGQARGIGIGGAYIWVQLRCKITY